MTRTESEAEFSRKREKKFQSKKEENDDRPQNRPHPIEHNGPGVNIVNFLKILIIES